MVETWALGSATASIKRSRSLTRVVLRGIVTARSFEDLHLQMARESDGRRRVLVLGRDALLTMTNQSAVEAAVRGTPATHVGAAYGIFIEVPPWRMPWALRHCALLCAQGLPRSPRVDRRSAAAVAAKPPGPARPLHQRAER